MLAEQKSSSPIVYCPTLVLRRIGVRPNEVTHRASLRDITETINCCNVIQERC